MCVWPVSENTSFVVLEIEPKEELLGYTPTQRILLTIS